MLLLSTMLKGLPSSRDGARARHGSASACFCPASPLHHGFPGETGRDGGCPGLATCYSQVQRLGSTSRCSYLLTHIPAKPTEV